MFLWEQRTWYVQTENHRSSWHTRPWPEQSYLRCLCVRSYTVPTARALCADPRLQWSCVAWQRHALPETPQIHSPFDFESFFFGHCTFRSQLLLLNSLWPSTFSYMTPKGVVTHSLRICTPGKSLLPEGAAWPLSGDNQTNRDFRHGLVASVWRAALAVIKVQCLWNKHFKFFILSFERGQARWGKLIHFYCQFFHRHPLNG